MDETPETSSVVFTVRRITHKTGWVNVPVTSDVMLPQPDGTGRWNLAETVRRAVEPGHAPQTQWHMEAPTVKMHPIQKLLRAAGE